MANFADSFFAGQDAGIAQRQQREAEQKKSALARLFQRAYTDPAQRQGALGQMAGIDPGATMQAEQAFGQQREQQEHELVNFSRLMLAIKDRPEAATLWQRNAARISQVLGAPELANMQYDPVQFEPVLRAFATKNFGGDAPAGVQEFEYMTQGMTPEQKAQAQRIRLGIDPRASSGLPFSFMEVMGPDGSVHVVATDKRTGAGVDVQPGGAPAPTASGSGQMPDIMAFADNVRLFGGKITSGYRTQEEQNALIAQGKTSTRNSQHTDSTGIDVVFPNAQAKALALQAAKARGINALDEGNHVHFGIPRAAYRGPGPYTSPTPGAIKRDETLGSKGAEFDIDQERAQFDIDQAAAKAGAEASAKAGAERSNDNVGKAQALQVYDVAMAGIRDGLSRTPTGPIIGRAPALTSGQQIAEGSVAAIAPVLKQLFRSAGEGVFTDKDQELLIRMIPTRQDTPEARDWKIQNIDAIVKAKLNAAHVQQPAGPKTYQYDNKGRRIK